MGYDGCIRTQNIHDSSQYLHLMHFAEANVGIQKTWDHFYHRKSVSSFRKANADGKHRSYMSRSLISRPRCIQTYNQIEEMLGRAGQVLHVQEKAYTFFDKFGPMFRHRPRDPSETVTRLEEEITQVNTMW